MIKNITLGSDSEIIINDLAGHPFPVCGMLGGTKDAPRKLAGTKYFIQEDNALLEYNVPVCKTYAELANHVVIGAQRALSELPPALVPSFKSTAVYAEEYGRIPQVMVFGCDPDYNVYTLEQNPRPKNDKEPMLRSAAGHIHIGWDNPERDDQVCLVKAMDIFLGLPSVWESGDRKRRTLYGKAGTFRPKEYGLEYRVLDNYWIFDIAAAKQVTSRIAYAVDFTNQGIEISAKDEDLIQRAINSYDTDLAHELNRKYRAALSA